MLNLALIGLGRWGTNIKNTLENIPGVKLQYICDFSPPQMRGRSRGGEIIQDYKKLLEHDDLDAVLIATPGSTHAEIALPFIKKGLPVFIEKPLTTNLADAKKLATAAKKSGSLIFVGHIHLYNPAYLKAKQLAAQAGPIRALYFEGMNNGPYRDDMSALWDWAPHDVAMATDLLAAAPTHVQAWGSKTLRPHTNLHDSAQIKLVFSPPHTRGRSRGGDNISALINVSWLFPEKRKKLTIIGSKDSIIYDDTLDKKITLFKNMGPTVQSKTIIKQNPKISYPAYAKTSPLETELKAFVKSVKTKQAPLTDINHALAVIKIIAAAEKSIALDGRLVRC